MRGTNDDHGKKNFTTMDDALIRQQPVTGIGLRRLAQLLRTNQEAAGTEPPNLAFRWSLAPKVMWPPTGERSAARMMDTSTRYSND